MFKSIRNGLLPYVWILAAFAISRILYYAAGVRFQTELIRSNFQFIDVDLLKNRLAESLFYYHMYPPLHNLIVGLLVKAFPNNYGGALHALHIMIGATCAILLYQLMSLLAVPARLAVALTIVFITSPACVLFENYPMYEYMILALLLAQCVSLYRLFERPDFWRAFLFFSLLATLAMLRAFYHFYYLIAVAVALCLVLRKNERTIAAAAAIPLLFVCALYAKNFIVFGFFGGSSWLGNNLPTVTTHNLSRAECESLVRAGKLDSFGCVDGSLPPWIYLPYVADLKDTGVPVLDRQLKSTGAPNFNHQVYLKTGPMFARTAKQVLRYYPVAYFRSVMIAWFCYFRPASDFFQFEENLAPIRKFDRVYNLVAFGQWGQASGKELRELNASGRRLSLLLYTGVFLILSLSGIVSATIYFWIRDWRRNSGSLARQAVIAFMVLQILMVAGIANFLSSFENNRYRFPTDGMFLVLFAVLLTRLFAGPRRKRDSIAADSPR